MPVNASTQTNRFPERLNRCQHCDRVLTFAEILELWCDACERKTIPMLRADQSAER